MSTSREQLRKAALDPAEWVDAYGDYLFRYAVARLGDSSAAEEVVQEAFLAGVRYADRFAGDGTQRGWLMGILKRKIVDFIRARARRRKLAKEDDHDVTALLFDENGNWKANALPTVTDEDQLESRELWEIVQGCLKRLPQGQADVFVLSVMEELNSEEICKELGISSSNLWVRMHRARLGLAKCVGAKWNLSIDGDSKGE